MARFPTGPNAVNLRCDRVTVGVGYQPLRVSHWRVGFIVDDVDEVGGSIISNGTRVEPP